MKKKIKDTIKIGEVNAMDYLSLGIGTGIGDWNNIGKLYNEEAEFLKTNKSNKPFSVTIADVLNPTNHLQDKLIEWDKKLMQETLKRMNTTQQNA